MRHPIPRQYQGGWSLAVLETYADSKAELLKVTIVAAFLLKLASLGGSFYLVSAMICSLQLAVHLPIMQFVFPTNVMVYLHSMVPVATLDVLENLDGYQAIFASRAPGLNVTDIREQVKDLHYEQHNPWLNMGTMALAMAVWLARVALLGLVLWPIVHYGQLQHVRKALDGNRSGNEGGDRSYEGGRATSSLNPVAKAKAKWADLKESGWIGHYQEPPPLEFGKPGAAGAAAALAT